MTIIDRILNLDWQDIAARALGTFLQAFLAVALVGAESLIDLLFAGDWGGLWTLSLAIGIAGLAAGLSALKTLLIEVVRAVRA